MSVESAAVKVAVPATADFTVKVTIPLAVEVPDAAEIESLPPRLDVRVTVFPEIGLDCASFRVIVKVELEVPLAASVLKLELTLESIGLIAPTVKLIV